MPQYSVVLFHSPSHAARAEKLILQAGIRARMIPTPRELSSDCGMALRFEPGDQDRVISTLAEHQVPFNGIQTI